MPNKKNNPALPLTFEVDDRLLDSLRSEQKRKGARSVSEIVRQAVTCFDYTTYTPQPVIRHQISVRVNDDVRRKLNRTAASRGVSVGEVVRAALSRYLGAESGNR